MIEYLEGTLAAKEPMSAVVDVGGVAFAVQISLHTHDRLPAAGERVRLLTHLHVREDALQLFGFADTAERQIFRLLQGISGIGARMALNVLSGISPDDLRLRVSGGDVAALTRIPGIGKKTAERIIVELRDRFAKGLESLDRASAGGALGVRDEALMALQALGYARPAAEKALSITVGSLDAPASTASELVKSALKLLNS
ncbi:MAG: Holliday junction branch migration protein RuvA [Bacteroidota bacterium]|jgi:Holliday junction DNA helicase RuvA|nr:Holliday junction branch migration protein RuvA [Bacteroidota bacterium]